MSPLARALERFSGELRGFTSRISDGVAGLKRGAEARPHAGVDAFKENLDDLEQQVADAAAELQQLERCTTDAVSFEELLGHCAELYQSNRQGVTALVAHIERYGYQAPPGARREPEDPCASASAAPSAFGGDELCLDEDFGDGMLLDSPGAGGRASEYSQQSEQQQQQLGRHGGMSTASSPGARRMQPQPPQAPSRSLPASPVSTGLLSSGYVPSRLGIGQPGSPARGTGAEAAAAAAAAFALSGPATGNAAATACKTATGRARPSMGGASSASLTPEGLSMLSPGLADKYACPSSGVPGGESEAGAPSLASGGSAAPSLSLSTGRRTCRDLRMDYGRCTSDSPNLPIFGKTPRSTSLPASTVSDLPDALSAPPAEAPAAEGAARGLGRLAGPKAGSSGGGHAGSSPLPDTTDTSDLYDMLIRSNMGLPVAPGLSPTPPLDADRNEQPPAPQWDRSGGGGAGAGAGAAGASTDDESCPVLARPTTPGRTLPAGWHEHALQELDTLTLTLSQLKRTPSRGRLGVAAGGDDRAGRGGFGGGDEDEDEDITLGERLEEAAAAMAGVAAAEPWEVMADADNVGPQQRDGRARPAGGSDGAVLQQRQEVLSPPLAGASAAAGKKLGLSPLRQRAQDQAAAATPTTRAALRRQLELQQERELRQSLAEKLAISGAGGEAASAAAAAAAAPVSEAEFSSLPAWCNRQLTLEELNHALEGMGAAAADRAPMDGAPAGCVGLDTLEALGFDGAKGRAIFNCLSKLGRAQLQRASGGAVVYRLVARV